jgi:hypothetical protein
MSTLLLLLVAAWVALITVAFVAACAQAVVHFLPPLAGRWQPVVRMAPTLAEERAA